MKLSAYAIIITILAIGFGLAFVIVPVKVAAVYGISLGGGGIVMARYFGVSNLFIGTIFFSYSSVSPAAKSWPKLLLYSLIYDILQLGVTLRAMLKDGTNSMGWTTVALFALLAIGSLYFMGVCNRARAQTK
jgi:hypothetical protein